MKPWRDVPFEQIAADWLRLMGGGRSQRAFSRRLVTRTNIALVGSVLSKF